MVYNNSLWFIAHHQWSQVPKLPDARPLVSVSLVDTAQGTGQHMDGLSEPQWHWHCQCYCHDHCSRLRHIMRAGPCRLTRRFAAGFQDSELRSSGSHPNYSKSSITAGSKLRRQKEGGCILLLSISARRDHCLPKAGFEAGSPASWVVDCTTEPQWHLDQNCVEKK